MAGGSVPAARVRITDCVEAAFPVGDEVDQATLEREATPLRAWIEPRTAALAEQRPA